MNKVLINRSWLLCQKPNPAARMRLVCFPYAGGNARIYDAWAANLPEELELHVVQLPGRGNRFADPLCSHISGIVPVVAKEIMAISDKPLVFFGHSMGALLGFETARQLLREYAKPIGHLFVSAFKAPHLPRMKTERYRLSDEDLIEELRHFNGTPEILLKDKELMDMFLPVMRADLEVCETYEYRDDNPLPFPITAFGGLYDQGITPSELSDWYEQTSEAFQLELFQGDHFIVHSHRNEMLDYMKKFVKPMGVF
ncbi:thioesterase II family protein [Paenibacillus sp. MMS18-CY102]|uniref:thioesterase II family protein n=1 Tax=Paenibacillus sp. MMS18-CY102 TaxID=2682849 RepID=UPI0013660C78|nr:alpha/beta fold hydrolase [Paenibacillus sp. MMS18-CY102]MWC28972.1 putative thioesterase [Paenibacillus sp. MMS18-CY102]